MATKGKIFPNFFTKTFQIKKQAASVSLDNQCPVASENVQLPSAVNHEAFSRLAQPLKSFKSIPGPKGLPFIGTLYDYIKKDGLRLEKLFDAFTLRSEQYGPIFTEKIANFQTIVISDPAEYRKVIKAEGKYPVRHKLDPFYFYCEKRNIQRGLANSDGEEWYKYRSSASKKMLKMKEVSEYCTSMDKIAHDFVSHISRLRNPQGEIIDFERECFKWSMESIGTFLFESRLGFFGPEPASKAHEFMKNLREFFTLTNELMYNPPVYKYFPTKMWNQYEICCDSVFRIARSYINEKLTQIQLNPSTEGGKASFIEHMINQESLTQEQALSICTQLLVASTETTTTGVLWALYSLARNPEVQEELYKETKRVLPSEEIITPERLSQLKFVRAVLKETLRLYPLTFATSRFLDKDVEIGGYLLPSGVHVQANIYGMFRNSQYFPEPSRFSPERWLKDSNMDKELKATSNLVWGHGARLCIGRRFAEQEIHILLTKIMQKYKVEYNHGEVEPVLSIVMRPDRPLLFTFTPRK